MTFSSLLAQFRELQNSGGSVHAKAKRGLAFEHLLSCLFRQQGISITEPFRIVGEQIDGAFEFKGWTYLVEAKWQGSKTSTAALYAFQGKLDRRIEGTRGLFISMSGYHNSSVNRFSEGRKPNTILWSGEHIQTVLEDKLPLAELIDASIRYAAERSNLLIPLKNALGERTANLFALAIEASTAQVEAEISATVGRKFIPNLYVDRNVQQDIDQLIHPEREMANLLAELTKLGIHNPNTVRKPHLHNGTDDPVASLSLLLDSARSRLSASSGMGSTLRLFLDTLPRKLLGRMHVITSRAGMGKTNLLCHLAKIYALQQPTVFLTGRSGITEGATIKELIESKLARYLRAPFPLSNCFERLISVARAKGTSLLIIIDALNEHKDLDLVNAAISHLLHEVAGLPVVILASCRDVYWPFFDTSLWPAAQWKLFDRRLDRFSINEYERAIVAYFEFYNIVANLAREAKEKLSHPLILRFFCEAYGDPSSEIAIRLHEIPDIRLKILFDEYLKRKLDSICHTAPQRFRTPRSVLEFLFRLTDRMRTALRRDVLLADVPEVTGEQNLESPQSVYVSILGEDILLEEEPDAKTGQIQVVFTYDEFMEYMIARSMLRAVTDREQVAAQDLVEECQNGAAEFRSFVGVLEYLGVILKEEWQVAIWSAIDIENPVFGAAACRAVAKLGPEYVGDQEIDSLESIAGLSATELRLQSVQALRLVASSERFEDPARRRALEVLLRILRHEDDVVIRSEAAECFEKQDVASMCAEGHRFAIWFKRHRKNARFKGILFSEDVDEILEVYSMVFARAGWWNLSLSRDAESTLLMVESVRPALVVTDLNKGGGMNGVGMAQAMKAKASTSEIPILLVSGGVDLLDDDKYSGLFCGVLSKPVILEELVRVAEMAIIGKYTG